MFNVGLTSEFRLHMDALTLFGLRSLKQKTKKSVWGNYAGNIFNACDGIKQDKHFNHLTQDAKRRESLWRRGKLMSVGIIFTFLDFFISVFENWLFY